MFVSLLCRRLPCSSLDFMERDLIVLYDCNGTERVSEALPSTCLAYLAYFCTDVLRSTAGVTVM